MSQSKHLQYVSGGSSPAYWIANFFWDITVALVPYLVFIGVGLFTHSSYLCGLDVFLIYWSFTFASILQAYCMSFFCETPGRLQTAMYLVNAGSIAILMLTLSATVDLTLQSAEITETLPLSRIFTVMFPTGGLLIAIFFSVMGPLSGETLATFSPKIYAGFIAASAVFYTILLIIFEVKSRYGLADWLLCARAPLHMINPGRHERPAREDPDVAAEREAVLNGERENAMYYPVVCYGLRKVFPPRRSPPAPAHVAVSDLHFAVAKGECFGLLGSNGAGKTSVLQMLTGGMLPTSGAATVSGFDIQVRF